MIRQIAVAVATSLVLGTGIGYWLGRDGGAPPAHTGAPQIVEQAERQPLFYRHPMNPEITSPAPAKDSMGMDYIPVFADSSTATGPAGTVIIDPATVQSIGVRTFVAQRQILSHSIQTVGRVDYDERLLTRLHPRTDGWIEKLFVNQTGQFVDEGTILLGIYSPQLVAAQQEYLLALKNLKILGGSRYRDIAENAVELASIARKRLELLGVPEHQIKEIEDSGEIKERLHIHSPFKGAVLSVGVREGQHVTAQTELYEIADLSKVWVIVDVYEYELPWVSIGDQATMEVMSLPGRRFEGTVSYIYPYLESRTRTVKIRLEFDNHDFALKPDTFADIELTSSRQLDTVVAPEEAIVRSGRTQRVFVVREPGRFEPREVTTGVSSRGMVQILEGLAEGEEIVTSGQFLIDSESRLREAIAKMREIAPAADVGQDKEGHDHD